MTESQSTAHAGGRFIGRRRELDELRRGLRDAFAGNGRLFLISGEAGIGKTRLADEVAAEAAAGGSLVLWGRCWESGGAPAYWPWVQLLRACFRAANAAAAISPDLARLLPDLLAVPPRGTEELPLEPEQARFRLFDAVGALLRARAETQPLLLIVDDLHAADADSLLLLRFLSRDLRGARLLIVGTYRAVEAQQREPTARLMSELLRDTIHLPLSGLSQNEVEAFIINALGSKEAPVSMVTAVFQATDGNPFFVTELVRLWIADGYHQRAGSTAAVPFRIPDQVREAVRQRLRGLSASTLEVLAAAAAIGREFDARLLRRILSPATAAALGEHLAEAVRADLLRDIAAVPGRRSFTHVLFRDTLYQDLAATQRLALHRQIGSALVEQHAGELAPHAADIAHHFFAAAVDGEVDDFIRYARLAAQHALNLRAFEDAVWHSSRALQALNLRSPDATDNSNLLRCDLLLDLGDALNAAGDRRQAKATFLQAANLARRLGVAESFARAALGFGGSWIRTVEPGDADATPLVFDDTLARLLAEARQQLASDHPLRARVLARLAVEQYYTSLPAPREAIAAEAIDLARRSGDPLTLAGVLLDVHVAIWGPDTVVQRRAMAEEVLQLAAAIGDPPLELMGLAWHVGDLFELGECELMDAQLERLRHQAESYRQPMHLWGVRVHLAARALLHGHFQQAEQLAEQALSIGGPAHGLAQIAYSIQLGALRRERAQLAEVAGGIATLQMIADALPSFPGVRVELAHAHAILGHMEEARRELDRVATYGFANIRRDNNWMNIFCEAAEVCAYLDDAARAAELYPLLQPYAHLNALGVLAALSWGAVARGVGVLASLRQDWDAAQQHFEVALQRNAALQALPWVARTQYDYAAMLHRRDHSGDRERAAALLAASSRTARSLGMKLLESRTAALLQQIPGPPSRRSQPPGETRPLRLENVLRREGDHWTVAYAGQVLRLRNIKGLHYLAHLLRHPGREFHVVDLAGTIEDRATAEARHGTEGEPPRTATLSAKAKATYGPQLEELRCELEEAQRFNDTARAAQLSERLAEIAAAVGTAVGVGQRDRRAGVQSERARMTVTKRIKDAIKKLRDGNDELGHHLATHVKTGYFCSYDPGPTQKTAWLVDESK